jgi:CBS domain containing-hemolysin-like protein
MIFLFPTVIVALIFSVFFAFSETSIFSIPREKYEILKNEKGSGRKIYEILTKSNLFLVFLLLGNNFVNIVAISGMEKLFGVVFNNNYTLVFICTTVILLSVGEIIPKNIAVSNPMFFARLVAPLNVFALKYLNGFLKKINSFNLYILRMNYRYLLQSPNPFVTSDEYALAIEEAVSNKKLSQNAGDMIISFLDLIQDSVLQTARNRGSLKVLENSEDEEQKNLKADEIAIKYDNLGNPESVYYSSPNKKLKKLSPTWFPTTKTIGDMHDFFLENDGECVLLVDEYGDFFGAVSKYDIYNYWRALCCDKKEKLSTVTLSGGDEIVKHSEWISPELIAKFCEIKTFNGILCSISGKIPQAGDTITDGDFVYKIIDADGTKINKIRIQKNRFSFHS